jgi:hypothetical protein
VYINFCKTAIFVLGCNKMIDVPDAESTNYKGIWQISSSTQNYWTTRWNFSNLMCSSYGRDNCANYFRLQGTLSFNTSIYIIIKIMKIFQKKETISIYMKNKCYTSRWIENFTYLTRKNIIKELGSILKQAAIFFFIAIAAL